MLKNENCEPKGLAKPCPEDYAPGSVRKVLLIRTCDVVKTPGCGCSEGIAGPLMVNADAELMEYHFQRDTVRFREKPKVTGAGTIYEGLLTSRYSGLSNTSEFEICRLKDGHYILIIVLWTGKVRRLGSLESPYLFKAGTDSQKRKRNVSGSDWEFRGRSKCPACYMDPDAPFTDQIIINDPPALTFEGLCAVYEGNGTFLTSGSITDSIGGALGPGPGQTVSFTFSYPGMNGTVVFDYSAVISRFSTPISQTGNVWTTLFPHLANFDINASGSIIIRIDKEGLADALGNAKWTGEAQGAPILNFSGTVFDGTTSSPPDSTCHEEVHVDTYPAVFAQFVSNYNPDGYGFVPKFEDTTSSRDTATLEFDMGAGWQAPTVYNPSGPSTALGVGAPPAIYPFHAKTRATPVAHPTIPGVPILQIDNKNTSVNHNNANIEGRIETRVDDVTNLGGGLTSTEIQFVFFLYHNPVTFPTLNHRRAWIGPAGGGPATSGTLYNASGFGLTINHIFASEGLYNCRLEVEANDGSNTYDSYCNFHVYISYKRV